MKKKKVIPYTRVGSLIQAQAGNSLYEQEQLIRKHCEEQGHEIVEVIHDFPNSKCFNPKYQDLLKRISEGKVHCDFLIATRPDRFSRKAGQAIIIHQELIKYDVLACVLPPPMKKEIKTNFFEL